MRSECTVQYSQFSATVASERDPKIGGTQSELRVTSLYLTLPPGWSGARKYRLGNSGGTLSDSVATWQYF